MEHDPWTPEVTRLLKIRLFADVRVSRALNLNADYVDRLVVDIADDCAHPNEVVERLEKLFHSEPAWLAEMVLAACPADE